MLDVFNIAKPQNCNIQIFYGQGTTGTRSGYSWNKPRGVSHVYILLIGAGASGDGATGGGSGAVTVWYGAAQNVPDFLIVKPSQIQRTEIQATFGTGGYIEILSAPVAGGSTGGAAMTANFFTASGFFQSVAGQNGTSGAGSASGTTFLSGGAGSSNAANYGYSLSVAGASGFFMLQPIIVGIGATTGGSHRSGIGCGGSLSGGTGGPGMVLIASW